MKKLFSISDCRSILIEEEGKVYALVDWKKDEWTYCDADGQLLLDYQPAELEEGFEGSTDDKTQVTEMINGFYGYSTHKVTYRPGGMDGLFGIKAKDGTKITEEIFTEIDQCYNYGRLSVRNSEKLWGCIDEKGTLVVPYKFFDPLQFNQYGIAVGNNTLIDCLGNEISGTELDLESYCDISYRYFTTALLTKEQCESLDVCGSAEGILVDIYDTKLRKYVVKGVPDGKLETMFFKGEPEVILAAMGFLSDYDKIAIEENGTFIAKKDGTVTIYDYYKD